MQWSNPGHEYDRLGTRVAAIRQVYIFGAGLNGAMLLDVLASRLHVAGFVDNASDKQRDGYHGHRVFAPAELDKLPEDAAIVVALAPARVPEALRELEALGHRPDYDLFSMQLFCPLYFFYRENLLCFPSLSFLPTTRCNLRCRDCLNFSPYIRGHENRPLEELRQDLDLLFSRVDLIMLFHISGGEPLLYPRLPELLSHIGEKYGRNIARLELATNGTVVPSEQLCRVCRQYAVQVMLDDYRESVPGLAGNFAATLSRLQEYSVVHRVNKTETWVSLLPDGREEKPPRSPEAMRAHFAACRVPWQEYRAGRLYSCNYAAYAAVAGIHPHLPTDFLQLRDFGPEKRAELLEFRLGFNIKGYTGFCSVCAGYGNSTAMVPAAKQSLPGDDIYRLSGSRTGHGSR